MTELAIERDRLELIDVSAPDLQAWFRGDTTPFDHGFRLLDDDEAEDQRRGFARMILGACRQVERGGVELAKLRKVARRRQVLRELQAMGYLKGDVDPDRRTLDRYIDEFLAAV